MPAMSTPWILYHLYSLNASSPDFLRNLYSLFRYDEQEHYLSGLQGSNLARLVDFLHGVRTLPFAFHQFTNQTPQTLSVVSANHDISRRCLYKLQDICGHHEILPSSCIVSGQITRVGGSPIAVGPIADVWEGTYRTEKVSIRCLKIPPNDDQTLKKVRVRCPTSSLRPLKNTCVCCSGSSKRLPCGEG